MLRLQARRTVYHHDIYEGQWLKNLEYWSEKSLNTNFDCDNNENGIKFYTSLIILESIHKTYVTSTTTKKKSLMIPEEIG